MAKKHLRRELSEKHPLTGHQNTKKAKKGQEKVFIDPLQLSLNDFEEVVKAPEEENNQEIYEAWKKLPKENFSDEIILPKPLNELFVSEANLTNAVKSVPKSSIARLHWLEAKQDDNLGIGEFLTYQEFLNFIEICNRHFTNSWRDDHRYLFSII